MSWRWARITIPTYGWRPTTDSSASALQGLHHSTRPAETREPRLRQSMKIMTVHFGTVVREALKGFVTGRSKLIRQAKVSLPRTTARSTSILKAAPGLVLYPVDSIG